MTDERAVELDGPAPPGPAALGLRELLAPLSVADFRARWFGKRPFAKVARDNPFAGLLTLEELEARLNDGCATLSGLTVVNASGDKLPRAELWHEQPGRGWSPSFLRKARLHELLSDGASCVLHNMSHITPRVAALTQSIEREFEGFRADVHVYLSARGGATGFRAHKDEPQHKLYLQLVGATNWTVYRGTHAARALDDADVAAHLTVDFQATLTPGSVIYLPPGVFHKVRNPGGPRVSLSIPFNPIDGSVAVDRHHIPLSDMIREGLGGEPVR